MNRLLDARANEIKKLKGFAYFRAFTAPIGITVPTIASVITFLTYAAMGNTIKASTAFTVVSLFTVVRGPFTILPIGIALFAQLMTAIQRLGDFFCVEPRPGKEEKKNEASTVYSMCTVRCVQCVCVCVL